MLTGCWSLSVSLLKLVSGFTITGRGRATTKKKTYGKWNAGTVYKWTRRCTTDGKQKKPTKRSLQNYSWPVAVRLQNGRSSMKTLFLFPQFNYMAPKEEAYFKMQGPEDLPASKMKEATNRWVPEAPSCFCFFCCFFFTSFSHSKLYVSHRTSCEL